MTPLLEIEGLVTRFPLARGLVEAARGVPARAVRAVDGISLSVGEGELVALVGESGSGKTTTAQTLMRMAEPAAGSIRFRGRDITRLGHGELKPIRRRMQMIYQDPYESLDPRFRIRRTVAEPLAVHRIGGTRQEREARVVAALERAGLTPAERYLDRFPHQLSGGQRQRVAIATALAPEPDLLIADEPVSMLDVDVRDGILALLDQLRRSGLGILMITHDLSVAARHADRIAVMYLGRIVEEGPAAEVVGDPMHPYTRALVSAIPQADPSLRRRPEIRPGEPPDPTAIPSGCRFHPRCPVGVPSCADHEPAVRRRGDDHWAACSLQLA
ncbi:ABC transporter ATP-binding protein [Nonomuraea sp. NPDC059194]|uniref:ABC transporter ATP-binding protein n=1 Tax=Nonomuraea sp. NPDC059194 TaxID=3346764 RepID=UPI0036C00875